MSELHILIFLPNLKFRMGYVLWDSGHGHTHGGLSGSHGHSHGGGGDGDSHGHSHDGSHSHGHTHGHSHGGDTPLNVRAALIHVIGDLLQVKSFGG